jgi:hypothetical protein
MSCIEPYKHKPIHEKFGCEISKKFFPQKIEKARKKLRLPRVLKVPRPQKGMTSSGISGWCHSNVGKLVKVIGGQQLLGYAVEMLPSGNAIFIYHSVWITPEGKLRDVTRQRYEEKYSCFIPITVWTGSKWVSGENFLITNRGKMVLLGEKWKSSPKRVHSRYSNPPIVQYESDTCNSRGGFSDPSLFTGKYRQVGLKPDVLCE